MRLRRLAPTTDASPVFRQAETLLKAGALQSAIFNSVNFSSIATDARGVIQIFNVGAERMLGYAAADVINKVTPADLSDPQELIARATMLSVEFGTPIAPGFEALVFKAARGIEDIYELTQVRKDGSRFPAMISVTALRDAQDAIIGYLLIVTDNTARQEVEEIQKKLDQRSRDQKVEQQFLQAQKMEAIGQLAAGVAHDFNGLLTVILGFCELLLEDLDPVGQHHADVTEIQRAGQRGAGLTRQLLTFSRKEIIEPTVLDVNKIVVNMRDLLARLIGADVEIVLALGSAVALVKADRGQLEQIVMNLAVNARDAMPTGGRLTIETANIDRADCPLMAATASDTSCCVMIKVTDTGTGIAADVQSHLFEPFFTTKAVGKGTGLGLATVHGIATRSGGTVTVDSVVGKGTSFSVYLPRADGAETVPVTPSAIRRPAGRRTVLVVEDNDGLRELTRRLVQRLGYTVVVAANAAEARQLVDQHASINLVLTDVVMPDFSGPELVKMLLERRPKLRVIYMSGYTDDAIVRHGVLEPGIDFLPKPFTSQTLGRKIRDVLDR